MRESSDSKLNNLEKQVLRARIMNSAQAVIKQKRRRKVRVLIGSSAAACFLLLFGLFVNMNRSPEPTLEEFVRTLPDSIPNNSPQLTIILDKDKININAGQNNDIQYSSSGKKVQIGNDTVLHQKVLKNSKNVFNTLVVPSGRRGSLTLSDGTKVWINAGSRLTYPAVFEKDARKVYLQGEAIFDVVHNENKPFKVLTNNQEIEVLGTEFNVSAYSDNPIPYTVLKKGKVRITYTEEKEIVIEPGTLASYNTETNILDTRKVELDEYFSWKEGYLTFKNNSIQDIAKKLSRYYNVKIRFAKDFPENYTFSGNLDLAPEIDSVLESINKAYTSFVYDVVNDKEILITTKTK